MKRLISIRTNIYKRKTPSGTVKWMVRWRSPMTGQWKAMTGGKTQDEALLIEAQVRQELAAGNDPATFSITKGEPWTVSMAIDQFLTNSRFLSGTESWKAENRTRVETYIRPGLGQFTFDELSRDRIYKFYLSLREKGLGRPTIHKTHTLLCLIGDIFVELIGYGENPFRKLKDFSRYFPKKAPDRQIDALTPEELKALFTELEKAKNPLASPLTQLLALTGMRRGEALAMKWSDVDIKSGFMTVRKSKNGQARKIPIDDEVEAVLSRFHKGQSQLICYKDGTRPHEDSFLKPLRKAAHAVGIEKRVDLHTLRHSFATNKLRSGFGMKQVSLLLGHADISTTDRVYTHLLDGDGKVREGFRTDRSLADSEPIFSQVLALAMAEALRGQNGAGLDRVKEYVDLAAEFFRTSGAAESQDNRK